MKVFEYSLSVPVYLNRTIRVAAESEKKAGKLLDGYITSADNHDLFNPDLWERSEKPNWPDMEVYDWRDTEEKYDAADNYDIVQKK